MMWEVVRRGPSGDADHPRMVWSSRDGKYGQETASVTFEVWQVTWRPRIRNPRQARMEEQAMYELGRRMGANAITVLATRSHHVWCARMPRSDVITAPDPEVGRLLRRRGPEAVRIWRRQGTRVEPDRVMRSVTVYEYRLKDPREGGWTLPQTLMVDNRTGLPVQASAWVAGGLPGTGGFPGGSPFGLTPGGFGPPAGRVRPAGTEWRPGIALVEYYDHNAPFTITVPPVRCRGG